MYFSPIAFSSAAAVPSHQHTVPASLSFFLFFFFFFFSRGWYILDLPTPFLPTTA